MTNTQTASLITLHDRTYQLPAQPTVVVCVDGFDPSYLSQGIEAGIIPTLKSFVDSGFHVTAKSAMPSVTNPNNCCIITGAPTVAHGIATNYFLDRETGKENMILDDSLLRGDTILQLMSKQDVRVAAITAKDKLRLLINHGLFPSTTSAISFSAQYPSNTTLAEHGITGILPWLNLPAPPQYSGALSLFVLDAGLKLLKEKRSDLLYLTLSDYIQHKHAPGSPEANEFMQELDKRLGEMVKLGAVVVVTGDHGMSAKTNEDGTPNVVFLEDELEAKFGKKVKARVVCPIADPFVKHHGALGSFVRVYLLGEKSTKEKVMEMLDFCRYLPQVEMAMTGAEAAKMFEMPLDREGDMVVLAKDNAVIGAKQEEHDLEGLGKHKLRSHGGLSEQHVPLLRSAPVENAEKTSLKKDWRNFDAFDLALNWR